MHNRMTITLDEAVYEGLYRIVGKRHIPMSQTPRWIFLLL